MSKFDPPSDPYGGERRCRICDSQLEYNPLTRSWECTRDHDAPEMAECSECCHEVPADTLRPDPKYPSYKICPSCMAQAEEPDPQPTSYLNRVMVRAK
jgi:hypothetical protein